MDIASHMRVSAAVLFLMFSVLGQSQLHCQPSPGRRGQPSQGANQNASALPLTKPSAQPVPNHSIDQPMPTQSGTPGTPASSSSEEPKEAFSQLTLFLFASGLALFIALLGWSDQIRGIDQDTRELEQRFLMETGINKRNFLDIVKPESPDDQLVALTQAVNDGQITTKVSVEVLRSFTTYVSQWARLEGLSALKYNMTIALTIALFAAGTASLFTNPTQHIQLVISFRVEMIVLVLPMTLIGLLLIIIIWSAREEKALRSLLNAMSDRV
jgi:hypothetical protein